MCTLERYLACLVTYTAVAATRVGVLICWGRVSPDDNLGLDWFGSLTGRRGRSIVRLGYHSVDTGYFEQVGCIAGGGRRRGMNQAWHSTGIHSAQWIGRLEPSVTLPIAASFIVSWPGKAPLRPPCAYGRDAPIPWRGRLCKHCPRRAY